MLLCKNTSYIHIPPTTVEGVHDSSEAASASSQGLSQTSEAAPEQHILEHLLLQTRSLSLVYVQQKLNLGQSISAIHLNEGRS